MPSVLLADDDNNLRDTLSAALRDEGFDVISCTTGAEVLEYVATQQAAGAALPDAFILDCLLPKKQGFEVAAALRTLNVTVPTIFISGIFKSKEHHDEGRKLGAIGFLNKPFSTEKLIELVERASGSSGGRPGATAAVAAPMPPEGNLLENPVLHLLWRAGREGHSGILDVFGPRRGRVFLFKGRITMAQCSSPQINVGVELIRLGLLTGPMYERLVQFALERRRGLYELIKDEDWVDATQLKTAYRKLIPRAVGFIIAASGRFRWTETTDFKRIVPAAPTSVKQAIDSALRGAKIADLEVHVTPRGTFRLAPGPNFDEIGARLEAACGSNSLLRSINGRATIAQMLAAARNDGEKAERMRQAYMLMSTQAVIASTEVIDVQRTAPAAPVAAAPAPKPPAPKPPAPKPRAATPPRPQPAAPRTATPPRPQPAAPRTATPPRPQPAAPQAPRPTPTPARATPKATQRAPATPPPQQGSSAHSTEGAPVDDRMGDQGGVKLAATNSMVARARRAGAGPTPEDTSARKKIIDKLASFDGKNHYEVLGIRPESDAAAIKKAYFALAREYHTDAFAGRDLGDAADALDMLFSVIQDANAALTNDKKRGNYDAALAMEAQGMSTDIAALMEAENTFSKAKTLVTRGEMPGAVKLLEKCLTVSPGNEEWLAYRDYARWWIKRDAMKARALVPQLSELGKKLQGIPDVTYFAGAIALEVGDLGRAKSLLKKCLALDPRHAKANSALRRLHKSVDGDKKKGGLGRFLKR